MPQNENPQHTQVVKAAMQQMTQINRGKITAILIIKFKSINKF